MPRRKLQFLPGHYYHIYNRGANRQSIFLEDRNYLYLLRLLKQTCAACQVSVIAYCLLPNHYHWLLRQDGDIPVRDVPKRVFGSYSQAYNKAYHHSGVLFEGPYRAIHIDTDEYLRHLCRYIHANPVRHGIADALELWPYSNYLDWIGKRHGTLLDPRLITQLFHSPATYQATVEAWLTGQIGMPPGLQSYLDEIER